MEQDSTARQQVRVTILNQSFTLFTSGNPNDMLDLANQVDELMTSIARKSPNLDSTKVAVFACLHLADQLRSHNSTSSGEKGLPAISEQKLAELSRLLDQAIG